MNKFEEYDLYAKNKDYLVSDNVLTFTDTNGKLMALKPDVTLSIIKNCKDRQDSLEKVYYNENVYRISKSTHSFQEIMTNSSSNFLLARHPALSGKMLYERLREQGILVRHFDTPRLCEYNRITVGSEEQMQVLIAAVRDILEAEK